MYLGTPYTCNDMRRLLIKKIKIKIPFSHTKYFLLYKLCPWHLSTTTTWSKFLSLNQKLIRLIYYWPTSSILLPSQKKHHNTWGNSFFFFFFFPLLERGKDHNHMNKFFFILFIWNLFGWFLFGPKVSYALSFRGTA